jgi:hypothetical protein
LTIFIVMITNHLRRIIRGVVALVLLVCEEVKPCYLIPRHINIGTIIDKNIRYTYNSLSSSTLVAGLTNSACPNMNILSVFLDVVIRGNSRYIGRIGGTPV